jgi:excisionase family DNA binding protein
VPTTTRPKPAPPPELLSIIDAGVYLGVSRRTVYDRLIEPNGPLETVHIGARRLVTRESLLRFVSQAGHRGTAGDFTAPAVQGRVDGSPTAA